MKRSKFFIQSLGMGLVVCVGSPLIAEARDTPGPRYERESSAPSRERPRDRGEEDRKMRLKRAEHDAAGSFHRPAPEGGEKRLERSPDRDRAHLREDIERARREVYGRPPRQRD